MTAAAPSLLLPEGTCLIHIGPSKTGTTAIQGAFHVGRNALLAQGVRYVGASRSPWQAAIAASSSRRRPVGGREAAERWRRLLAEVRRSEEPRLVISSEHFAKAEAAAIRRIAAGLEPRRVHVAVTLRPLARILPSRWQQDVQMGLQTPLDDWLRIVFDKPTSRVARTFWREHRHDRLVARWADRLGADRVTVIVLDERDHGYVLRVLEQMTGLREGTLAPVRDVSNRSLTLPEIEAVRALNERLRADGLVEDRLERVVRHRAADYLKHRRPPPAETRIELPAWAAAGTAELAAAMVAGIRSSGVRVIGDRDSLAPAPTTRDERARPDEPHAAAVPDAPAEIGAWLAAGLYRAAADLTTPDQRRLGLRGRRGDSLRRFTRTLMLRARQLATRRAHAVRGRLRPSQR